MERSKSWLVGAICFAIGFIFQLYGTIRYIGRLSDDYIGIVIYSATTVFFAIAAIGFFSNYRKTK
jgi:hypothetical protein